MRRFDDLNLPEVLAQALDTIGFIEPTEVQQKSIPIQMDGQDLIACAETGSGKTGAYLIPMIKALLENPKAQGMVLAPTRELAVQIADFLQKLIPRDRAFPTARLVGGQDIRKQFKSLQRKPRVIVATPGRLIDHLKRNTVQIHKVKHLVLDEGDRMIDMGFAPQLEQILKYLEKDRQTAFFTATLDNKVQALAQKYLESPKVLKLHRPVPVAKIKQSIVRLEIKEKKERILDELNARQGSVIVFVKTQRGTHQLKKHLAEYGFAVDMIHGGCTQGKRNQAIKGFKKGTTRILCATDVAARGIDVPQIEHVINFDLPMQDEDYVHRVGRTARNGAEGEAVSFVTPQEHKSWNRIAKKYEIPGALLRTDDGKPSRKKSHKKPRRHSAKKRTGASQRSQGKSSARPSANSKARSKPSRRSASFR